MQHTTEEPKKNTPTMPADVSSKPVVGPGKGTESGGRDMSKTSGPEDRDTDQSERKMGGQSSGRSLSTSPEPAGAPTPHPVREHPGTPTPTHDKIEEPET
jgi:hypothetical protein